MKTLYATLFFLTALTFNQLSQAQCSEIYFYRTNGFQSKRAVTLYHNGKELATINAGERYKATVCNTNALEFVVRTSEKDMVPSKVDIKPQNNTNYYLKVSCAAGVEIASIKVQELAKGKKDVNNGNKFLSELKTISIGESAVVQGGGASQTSFQANGGGQTFEPVQVIDNFKFEIAEMVKAGEMLTISYKITNLAAEDRRLETCANMIYFYDDLGNLSFAQKVCLANSCSNPPSWMKTLSVSSKYACHSKVNSNTIMPSGIPLNGQITVQDINKRASKFVRGTVWFKSEVAYKIDYFNVEFPKVIDANNPNKRNFGSQSIELVEAARDSTSTYVRFKHTNLGAEPYSSKIKTGQVYDDQGNQHTLDGMSLISKDKRVNYRPYFKGWDLVVNPNSTSEMYAILDKIPPAASEIRRITLSFEGFSLSWENIPIVGGGDGKQPGPEYMPYTDFEKKVRGNENVLGTKVILKKIYFSTGSDVILKNSHGQLDQLGDLLKLNSSLKVEVSGHTDDVGDDLSNMLLSQKRADAIKYYLIGKSVLPNRIISIGKGENEPIRENTNAAGRQENRRVELTVVE